MKKIILVLTVILISTNTLRANNFNWSRVGSNVENDVFYLDKRSIFKVGKYHYYWSLIDNSKSNKGDETYQSNITLNIANCNTFENKTVTYTSFKNNTGKGPVDIDIVVPDESMEHFVWRKFTKNNTMYYVLKDVCKVR